MVFWLKYGVPSLIEGLAGFWMLPLKLMSGIAFSTFSEALRWGIRMPRLVRSTAAAFSGLYVSVFWLAATVISLNVSADSVLVACSVASRPGCWNEIGTSGKFSEPATHPAAPAL